LLYTFSFVIKGGLRGIEGEGGGVEWDGCFDKGGCIGHKGGIIGMPLYDPVYGI
jgi:hypothetical protein